MDPQGSVRVSKYPSMDKRLIVHMPGAGGNFMTRVCEQAHRPEGIIHEAQYWNPVFNDQHHPAHSDWKQFERGWIVPGESTRRYWHSHSDQGEAWLRIVITTRPEWDWACANARWKNSFVEHYQHTSDPDLPSQHRLPLSHLWQWPTLAQGLRQLGLEPNPHCETLWRQWRDTWCPHSPDSRWQSQCRQLWDHLRPSHIQ